MAYGCAGKQPFLFLIIRIGGSRKWAFDVGYKNAIHA